jgi:two-component system LytT family sensor kinase
MIRKLKWRQIISYIGVTILTALFFSVLVYFAQVQLRPEKPPSLGISFLWQSIIYDWAILLPAINWFAARFRLERENWRRRLPIHLAAALFFILAQTVLYTFSYYLYHNFSSPLDSHFLGAVQRFFFSNWLVSASMYLLILSFLTARYYSRRFQAEKLENAELKVKNAELNSALAASQLSALKMQLHPHFLFNTLNSISTLLHRDPRAADEMVARLGDFLRLTLENSGEQVVTLAQEMNFINRYLEIESIRFGDRLRLENAVEPGTLQARVPNLILQPIVENAVKHGISRQIRPGTISIRARRIGEKLQLEVEDDGPGLQNGKTGSGGIGLANTRSRLFNLYGDNQQIQIVNGAVQGLIVKLEIPFETNREVIQQ